MPRPRAVANLLERFNQEIRRRTYVDRVPDSFSRDSPIGGMERAARTSLSVFPERVALLAFGEEARADAANLLFSLAQGLCARVNGVATECELVPMRWRRAEHEDGVSLGEKVDRHLGGLEDRDLPAGNWRRGTEHAFVHGDPGHLVPLGRPVRPPLASLQAHDEVVHGRRVDGARHFAVRAQDDANGAIDGRLP